jgi:hypothetical protein
MKLCGFFEEKDVQQTREDRIEVHLIWFLNTLVSVFILKIQLVVSLNYSSCVSCIITLQFAMHIAICNVRHIYQHICSCCLLLGATCPIMMSKFSRGVCSSNCLRRSCISFHLATLCAFDYSVILFFGHIFLLTNLEFQFGVVIEKGHVTWWWFMTSPIWSCHWKRSWSDDDSWHLVCS